MKCPLRLRLLIQLQLFMSLVQLPRITPSGTDNRPVVDGVILPDTPRSLLARRGQVQGRCLTARSLLARRGQVQGRCLTARSLLACRGQVQGRCLTPRSLLARRGQGSRSLYHREVSAGT